MAILILSYPLPAEPFAKALRALAPDLPVWTDASEAPPEAVEAVLAWRLKPGQLAPFQNLRVLCSTGAGVDKLLVDDLPPSLPVTRVVDPLQAQAMAQYVVAITLRHLRDLDRYQAQQGQAMWQRHAQRPLSRCRVGVLGQGEVAQAIARGLIALGLPGALWGRSRRDLPGLASVTRWAGDDDLPALLASSDVLVNTLPLTPLTAGLLGRDTLSQLPQGAFLVNVGRGEQVVELDLRALLDSGHLAGAALDVLEREPPAADHWTWHHPRVVATPHIAGEARAEVVAAQCLAALQAARAGSPIPHSVNRRAGY